MSVVVRILAHVYDSHTLLQPSHHMEQNTKKKKTNQTDPQFRITQCLCVHLTTLIKHNHSSTMKITISLICPQY